MDLPSYSNMNTLIVLILLTIFKLQIYCRSRIFFILFCVCVTLHLTFLLSGLNEEIDITDQLVLLFFIMWINYCQKSNNSICHKTCKASGIDNSICHKTTKVPWIDNSEMSRLADLLLKNNILNKTGIKCEQGCTVVCSLFDSCQMGRPCNRLATFRHGQHNINCTVPVLVENGFFYSEESSAVQCFRCLRMMSHSDDMSNPHSWHEENCDFMNFRSRNYEDFFRQDQESEIHQQISESRRQYCTETARNAAGSGQIGSLPQAASQSTDGGCLVLASRDSTGTSPQMLRTQTTSALERSSGSAHSATFVEHLGAYSRTSDIARGDCSISEPANMVYTEITPTIRVTEGEQHWQSQAEMGHNTAVSVEPWASTQTVGTIVMNLPASHREIAAGNTVAARTTLARRIIAAMRRNNRRRHHSSRQQRCCRVS